MFKDRQKVLQLFLQNMRTGLHLDSIFSDPYEIWDPSNMLLEIIPIWIFNPTSKHT